MQIDKPSDSEVTAGVNERNDEERRGLSRTMTVTCHLACSHLLGALCNASFYVERCQRCLHDTPLAYVVLESIQHISDIYIEYGFIKDIKILSLDTSSKSIEIFKLILKYFNLKDCN